MILLSKQTTHRINHRIKMLTFNTAGTTDTITAVDRSRAIYLPALSSISIGITGTATVKVVQNPFGASALDVTLDTVTANKVVTIPSASYVLVDITAVSGTVRVSATPNDADLV